MMAHPLLRASAFLAAALLFATATAAAQTAVSIETQLTMDAGDYPVTVTHHYQNGTATATYTANGTYAQPVAVGLGDLVGVSVFAGLVAIPGIDNETTPGTGRRVQVTTKYGRDGSGVSTANIVIDLIAE